MSRRWRAGGLLLATACLTLAALLYSRVATVTRPASYSGISTSVGVPDELVPTHGAWWGAWVAPTSSETGAEAVSALEAQIGRRLDIVHAYHGWNETWPTATENAWAADGHLLFADLSSRDYSTGRPLPWTVIAGGSHDSQIQALAKRIKGFGHPMSFSFDEEPEGRLQAGETDPRTYVAAYRHIHDLFAAERVTNVVWVWNVSGAISDNGLYPYLWPRADYVDWIGYDPYNWFDCSAHPASWQDFDQIVAPFYNWVGAETSNGMARKPLMLAEWGTVENRAGALPNKGQWFADAARELPNWPAIRAAVYFDESKQCDWRVTTSLDSIDGFRTASQSAYLTPGSHG